MKQSILHFSDLSKAQIDQIVLFLNSSYENSPYNPDKPWPTVRPEVCITLSDDTGIIATQSVFRLKSSEQRVVLFGLGDLAVTHQYRGRGHAKQLVAEAIRWCILNDGDWILTNSITFYSHFITLGFTPTPESDKLFSYVIDSEPVLDPGKLVLKISQKSLHILPVKIYTPQY